LDFKDSKIAELNQLAAEGFETPHAQTFLGKELNDEMLADYINARRKDTDYAIDGIVIDVNSAEKRAKMNVGIGTGNPKSSIKYKVADASNTHIATVKSVEWNVSKHGYLKPRVVFEPFDLVGVTIKHATGFNAAFIQSEGIGPGAKVQMTRSGDVIPFIEKVITPATPMMPTEECVWNDTKVDLMLTESTAEVEIQQLIDFCASLNFPHLKEGNVRKLFDAGIDSCEQIVNASMVTLTKVIGTNGIKAYHGIQERLTQVPLFDVMGSVPFFGRGVGKRKFKQLISQIGADYETWSVKAIVKADGFDEITANKIIDGIAEFKQFQINTVDTIVYKGQVVATGELEGEKICMTGFRDQAMSDRIEELGGEVASGVSGKTTILVCTDPDSNSGKAKKAREINEKGKGKITIISVEDFRAQLENY
jgi:NAD-dependent DNA ligase